MVIIVNYKNKQTKRENNHMSESEHFTIPEARATTYHPENGLKLLERGEVQQEHTAEVPGLPELNTAEQDARDVVALKAAEVGVHEALESKSLTEIIDSLDFSEKKFSFVASDSYHAEAAAASSTRFEGNGSPRQGGHILQPQYFDKANFHDEKWGDPLREAHYSKQPVEKVGIRANDTWAREQVEKTLPIPGLLGKLGFKRKQMVTETVRQVEKAYTFDYEFAAPSHSEDGAALDVGNRTGQGLRLSLSLSKEQAAELSKAIDSDPTVARLVLDSFVAKTGDIGKWNAEIFDEEGTFHDPGERYGDDLRARDVRPRYEAVPQLKPEIIGLIGEGVPEGEQLKLRL